MLTVPAAPLAGAAPALSVRQQLSRTQEALFDAREVLLALRDEYPLRPGRFTRLRAAIQRKQAARAAFQAAARAFQASPEAELIHRLRCKYGQF
jgi:hypothetical protein